MLSIHYYYTHTHGYRSLHAQSASGERCGSASSCILSVWHNRALFLFLSIIQDAHFTDETFVGLFAQTCGEMMCFSSSAFVCYILSIITKTEQKSIFVH